MTELGNGLGLTRRHEDALAVQKAELAMDRRVGASGENILITQSNLANTYQNLGRLEEALRLKRDVYSGTLELYGEEYGDTILAALNYASTLGDLERFEEAKRVLRKVMPVARPVWGENHEFTLKMRWVYALMLYRDDGATLDDLREAVTTLDETERIARRVLGGTHPHVQGIECELEAARAALRAREGLNFISEALAAMPPPGSA